AMEINEIMRRPYRRIIIPDEESGTFTAMIAEFPGCITEGDSPNEAFTNLEDAAAAWLEAAVESGLPIPEPEVEQEYSGKVVLRMGPSIHRRAAEAAKQDGVSLNAFLISAISERLGRNSVLSELASMRRE
ncbi:MAG TPA: type II toxin-antitoxin system HicB family antitoxin, partial [Dehalococcoidia bacterium]|nr:type II toxin-antitoxin system HicB family antitoxin [Dehalococcoidia bacterium]